MDQPNKLVLIVELRRWRPFPARITPAPVPMRPDSSQDPAVETLEELTDVGAFVNSPQPRRSGLSPAISSSVRRGVVRLVRCRT